MPKSVGCACLFVPAYQSLPAADMVTVPRFWFLKTPVWNARGVMR
ncbi:hypothetical protein [Solitalea canadensis]|nr:hypothetical protein [Solitalea canadensis]